MKFLGPGVYVAKTPTEVLYVGSSKNIFGRTSEASHEALRNAMKVEGCEISIIIASSEKHARTLESYLIAERQPRFNKTGKQKGASAYKDILETYPEFDEGGFEAIVEIESKNG